MPHGSPATELVPLAAGGMCHWEYIQPLPSHQLHYATSTESPSSTHQTKVDLHHATLWLVRPLSTSLFAPHSFPRREVDGKPLGVFVIFHPSPAEARTERRVEEARERGAYRPPPSAPLVSKEELALVLAMLWNNDVDRVIPLGWRLRRQGSDTLIVSHAYTMQLATIESDLLPAAPCITYSLPTRAKNYTLALHIQMPNNKARALLQLTCERQLFDEHQRLRQTQWLVDDNAAVPGIKVVVFER